MNSYQNKRRKRLLARKAEFRNSSIYQNWLYNNKALKHLEYLWKNSALFREEKIEDLINFGEYIFSKEELKKYLEKDYKQTVDTFKEDTKKYLYWQLQNGEIKLCDYILKIQEIDGN